MFKINIYETGWLNIVFEGRNKAYGAYQLRTENPKTTVRAFFSALMLLGGVAMIPFLITYLQPKEAIVETPRILPEIIHVTEVKLPEEQIKHEESADSKSLTDEKVIKRVNMVHVKKENATLETVAANDELEKGKISSENHEGNKNNGNGLIVQPTAIGNGNENGTTAVTTVEMPTSLEVQPQYPGGISAFLNAVGKRFNTPEVDENVKSLKVLVYFVIEKDGTLSNIKVTRDPGYNLGKEASRVLNSINTKWSPGYKNGQPVRTAYNLPITVNIQ